MSSDILVIFLASRVTAPRTVGSVGGAAAGSVSGTVAGAVGEYSCMALPWINGLWL